MNARVEAVDAEYLYFPLKSATGGSGLTGVEVVAVDLTDADGQTGLGFSYALRGGGRLAVAAVHDLAKDHVIGKAADAPMATWRAMNAALNRLGRGLHYLAMAAVDVALWDLHAKQRGVTLATAMGGRARACRSTAAAASRRTSRRRTPRPTPSRWSSAASRWSSRG